MYLLDTNTVIYFFKRQGRVAERLLAVPPAEVALPSIVVYELSVGVLKSGNPERRRKDLQELLAATAILPFGPQEAAVAAQIRHDLERAGMTIGPYDLLIAGAALSRGATLVSHNTNEFSRVQGLSLEDWY